MATTTTITFTGTKLEPKIRPMDLVCLNCKFPASVNYAKGTILGELTGTNSKQSITPSTGANAITGGTYTLTYGAQTTAAINATASAGDIQAALEALSTIGKGNVKVTGGPLMSGVVYVEFVGAFGGAARTAITGSAASLTSGGTAAITINATLVVGAAGTPGTYKTFTEGNTDGSQNPRAILLYDIQTDASGNVTFSDTSGQVTGEWAQTNLQGLIAISGWFDIADLTGLTAEIGNHPGWTVKNGSIALGKGLLHLV